MGKYRRKKSHRQYAWYLFPFAKLAEIFRLIAEILGILAKKKEEKR